MMKTYHVRFTLNLELVFVDLGDSRFTEVTLRIHADNVQDAMSIAYSRMEHLFGLENIKEFSIHQF